MTKTTKSVRFMYKCRQCGEVFEDGATGQARAFDALLSACLGKRDASRIPPMLTEHVCDGPAGPPHAIVKAGVADLIGYEVVE